MDPAEREDLLLAVSRLESRNGRKPDAAEIAGFLQRSISDVQELLRETAASGEVVADADGFVCLTASGAAAAEVVMKKHKVLETFFEEMLGMDRSAAHKQACTLEHHASEETIRRLNRFICKDSPTPESVKVDETSFRMLADCNEGERVCIEAMKECRRAGRLADLGLIPGEEVVVLRRMAKTVLIQVKGCNVAISADIARLILVGICR
ncbi:MAG TPA: metal-dependent transcriptional regulator [Methanospirillum sp.]|uniref:metal-dependent transcriptional regulator n=1 Tax=Methanospirillum sp. TaxID=45200 RepID=UPI002D15E748|nr:metal-dependent transcriptional regulator [Methanospirillum sp.]HWQ64684.1 metal-dependent transcriptional regulator [Methanospirillum sp.]